MPDAEAPERPARLWVIVLVVLAALVAIGCKEDKPPFQLRGQVRVTFLHTSDIHSRLFPYNLQIGQVDAKLGLGEVAGISDVGGAARMSHIIGRERARSSRCSTSTAATAFRVRPSSTSSPARPRSAP